MSTLSVLSQKPTSGDQNKVKTDTDKMDTDTLSKIVVLVMAPKPKRELKNYALVSGKDASKSGKSRLWTSVVKTSEIKDGKVKGHPCKIRKIGKLYLTVEAYL